MTTRTLAALALYAVLLQWREGYQLRSRCQLIPVTLPGFEWIGVTAADRQIVPLDLKTAGEALQQLREQAKKKGLFWETGLIELQPQDKLIELVKKSDAFQPPVSPAGSVTKEAS